jgi:transcriptional regulator with XRE-family HTH domain
MLLTDPPDCLQKGPFKDDDGRTYYLEQSLGMFPTFTRIYSNNVELRQPPKTRFDSEVLVTQGAESLLADRGGGPTRDGQPFYERLANIRKGRKLEPVQMARLLRVDPKTYQRLEVGVQYPSVGIMHLLAVFHAGTDTTQAHGAVNRMRYEMILSDLVNCLVSDVLFAKDLPDGRFFDESGNRIGALPAHMRPPMSRETT